MAERLNGYLAANWKSFAKQPYFDQQGIFFSAMISAPLLLTMFILVVRCRVVNFNLLFASTVPYRLPSGYMCGLKKAGQGIELHLVLLHYI